MKPLDAFNPKPVTLRGAHVILEPLEARHAADLFEAGGDEAIWRFLPRPPLASVSDSREMVADALESAADRTQLPFAIVDRSSGKAVGSTRYLDIRRAHRGLEVGWTWLGRRYQRTAVNTESKYLLLSHAFEELGAGRVQFQTDGRKPLASKSGVMLSVLVQVTAGSESETANIYHSTLDAIAEITADASNAGKPIGDSNMTFRWPPRGLGAEIDATVGSRSRPLWALRLYLQSLFQWGLDGFDWTAGGYRGKQYRVELRNNTDYRRFDDTIADFTPLHAGAGR